MEAAQRSWGQTDLGLQADTGRPAACECAFPACVSGNRRLAQWGFLSLWLIPPLFINLSVPVYPGTGAGPCQPDSSRFRTMCIR
ncbi:unnamed protein product [Gadus morhua 'NCC']